MVSEALVSSTTQIAAILVVIAFVITLLLPKKIHFIVNGIILIVLGAAHIMYEFYYLDVHIRGSPIVRFVILFVVGATAKELIKESIHEKKGMKTPTFLVGIILIILALIPELYHAGAISFELPELPLFFSVLYIIGGCVAILSALLANE